MGKTYIADTCDVVFRRKSDGHAVFTAEAQLASIAQSISEEIIRGGIGNKPLYTVRHSKEVTLTVRNATFDLEWLAMTQGVSVTNGSVEVNEVEKGLTVVDNAGTLEVMLTGTPAGTTATVINKNGESEQATITGNKVTIPTGHAAANEKVDVIYKKSVTGDIVTLDASKFSENYEVEYRTIEYDAETNKVVKDIYFQFDNVIPSGSFDMSFENGSALTPELTFNAMADSATNQIGRIVEVARP